MSPAPSYIHTDHELVDLDDNRLRQLPNNPNHGDLVATARSLARFGLRDPLVVRRTGGNRGEIEAGNTRFDAARMLRSHVQAIVNAKGRRKPEAVLTARQQLGQEAAQALLATIEQEGPSAWSHVAVLWVDEEPEEGMAFALASNRTARLGHDDPTLLADMLDQIAKAEAGLLETIGYDDPPPPPDDDHPPEPAAPPARTTTTSRDEYDATATRTLALPMNIAVHAWVTAQLAGIRRHQGFETDTDALVWILEHHVGGTAPRDAPGLTEDIDEP